jgi:hypothetical protein
MSKEISVSPDERRTKVECRTRSSRRARPVQHSSLLIPHPSLRLVAYYSLLTAGCYAYRPLPGPAPAVGSQVELELSDEGSRALAGEVGPGTERLRGTVIRADSALVELAVQAVQNTKGEPTDWNGEPVRIPRQYLDRIQERRLSVGGTGILGGAIAAGLIAAYELFGGGGSSQGPLGGGPGGTPR